MKRLNLETNQPFKHGVVRNDGFIFWGYKTVKNKDGFFGERWYSPEKFLRYENENKVRQAKRHAKNRTTPYGRSMYLLNNARKRCREKGFGEVTISQQWVEERLTKGHCELTGLPFDFLPPKDGNNTNPYSPSLDRIDSNNFNYTPENTRVVLTCVNLALNLYGLDIMKPVFKKLAEL